MVLQTNMPALHAHRQLGRSGLMAAKRMQRLSSGYRINAANDDAAGLSISEKMRAQIRGLTMAEKNAQDGISLVQTADGAMSGITDMLQRMRELAIQSSNDTNAPSDRMQIDREFQQLKSEIDAISLRTEFNGMTLLDGTYKSSSSPFMAAFASTGGYQWSVLGSFTSTDGPTMSLPVTSSTNWTNIGGKNLNWLRDYIADTAVPNVMEAMFDTFSFMDYYRTAEVNIGLVHNEWGGAQGWVMMGAATLTNYVALQLGFSTNFINSLTTSTGFVDAAARAQFDSLLAHEMMHAIMAVTHGNGMLPIPGATDGFPIWFKEGTAQAVAGDMGWLSALTPTSTNGAIQTIMSQLTSNTGMGNYGAGYLATMYMGYLAAGGGTVDSATIAQGLNLILGEVAAGKSLNAAVGDNTSYANFNTFETAVRNGTDAAFYDFVRALVAAKGAGSGSILAELDEILYFATPASPTPNTFLRVDRNAHARFNSFSGGNRSHAGGGRTNSGPPVHPSYDPFPTTTPPFTVSGGAVIRSSHTNASVVFNSNRAGEYYFIVRDATDPPPTLADFNTGAPGTSFTGTQATINLNTLTSGAKTIYIVVKDADDNLSDIVSVAIPAFSDPTTDPPQITGVTGNRPSEPTGTFTFHSNAPGDLHYLVLDVGDPPPTIADIRIHTDTVQTTSTVGNNTINITGLPDDGPRMVYFFVENANGESVLQSVLIPAYVPAPPPPPPPPPGDGLHLQIGANAGQGILVTIESMDTTSLGVRNTEASTWAGAQAAITAIDVALGRVNGERVKMGAVMNRLAYTIENLNLYAENLSAANSRIRDADMAKEMMLFTQADILRQAAVSMLAQANQGPQAVLTLLR